MVWWVPHLHLIVSSGAGEWRLLLVVVVVVDIDGLGVFMPVWHTVRVVHIRSNALQGGMGDKNEGAKN